MLLKLLTKSFLVPKVTGSYIFFDLFIILNNLYQYTCCKLNELPALSKDFVIIKTIANHKIKNDTFPSIYCSLFQHWFKEIGKGILPQGYLLRARLQKDYWQTDGYYVLPTGSYVRYFFIMLSICIYFIELKHFVSIVNCLTV